MAHATVYYDYHEGHLAPQWYILYFGSLDWGKTTLYIPIHAPFEMQVAEDFREETIGLTVTIGELTLNPNKPKHIGIYLPSVRNRALELNVPVEIIEQFIIQVGDIEEVLQMELFRSVI